MQVSVGSVGGTSVSRNCSYHTAKTAAVLHHLSGLLVIYPFPVLHLPMSSSYSAPCYVKVVLC